MSMFRPHADSWKKDLDIRFDGEQPFSFPTLLVCPPVGLDPTLAFGPGWALSGPKPKGMKK
jgi:hypothetical protein